MAGLRVDHTNTMADTLLEQTRGAYHRSEDGRRILLKMAFSFAYSALHDELERMERVIVLDFKQETKTHKDRLMQGHRVRKRLDAMQESARKLVSRDLMVDLIAAHACTTYCVLVMLDTHLCRRGWRKEGGDLSFGSA